MIDYSEQNGNARTKVKLSPARNPRQEIPVMTLEEEVEEVQEETFHLERFLLKLSTILELTYLTSSKQSIVILR